MKRQKDTKTRVFVQKLIDDSYEQIFIAQSENFYKYSNKELFDYLDIGYKELIDILEELKIRGVIFQYECLNIRKEEEKSKKKGLEGLRTTGFTVKRKPDYGECVIKKPKDFLDKAQAYLSQPSRTLNDISDYGGGSILYLEKSGDLWHGDINNRHCYPMKAKSGRFLIFKYLVDNKGYQDTSTIVDFLKQECNKQKTSQNVRTEITKIRENISDFLDLDGIEFIQSKKDSGYRINPKYKILFLDK